MTLAQEQRAFWGAVTMAWSGEMDSEQCFFTSEFTNIIIHKGIGKCEFLA